MKFFTVLLCVYGLTSYAQGRYADSDVYVVCDVPFREYPLFLELGYFETESLGEEGFIHCARPNQLEYVMNKYFKEDAYVLFISTKHRLGSLLKYEGRDQTNLYPHLYRRFTEQDSLEEILVIRGRDGSFNLPPELAKSSEEL